MQAVSLDFFMVNTVLIIQIKQNIIAKDTNTHGTMIVPIILGGDKTTVSVATGNNEY